VFKKTTTATRVIDAISEKSPELKREDIPWTNDLTLFSDALKQDEKEGAIISYTPWYVERNVQLGGYGNVVPLKNYDGVNLKHGSAEEYVRAFFYVKPPNKKTVYRIGVPEMLFDRGWDRDTLRDIALAEMVKQFSEPLPIVMADEKVRISRNIRSQLRTLIYEEAQLNHNKGRGYDD
jgi:NurA domain.